MMLALLLWVTLQTLSFATANLNEGEQKFCGNHLARTMAVFCRGRYEGIFDDYYKRSSDGASNGITTDSDDYSFDIDPNLLDEIPYIFPLWPLLHFGSRTASGNSRTMVTSVGKPRTRRASDEHQWYVQRGIADECCKKPCSISTLLSYCRPTSY